MLAFARPASRTDGTPLGPDAGVEILMSLRDPAPKRVREIELDPSLTWSVPMSEWTSYEQGRRLEVGLTLARVASDLELPGGGAALKGRKISFIVEVVEGKRKRSDPSDIETFVVCDPPPAPAAGSGRITEEGLLIDWLAGERPDGPPPADPGGARFNVYRQEEGSPWPESPVHAAEPGARSWLDAEAAIGRPYRYVVRVVGGAGRCESADGPRISATRADLFPPAAPQGLAAVAEEGTMRLFWRPNREPDLRGYRVYRADGPSSAFRLLTKEDLISTSYTDEDVSPGVVYSYAVTARDGATPVNESLFSDQAIEAMKTKREDRKP